MDCVRRFTALLLAILQEVGGPQPSTMTVLNETTVAGMATYHRSTKLDRQFALNSGGYHQPLKSRPTKKKKVCKWTCAARPMSTGGYLLT